MIDVKSWFKKENIHLNLRAESELEAIRTMLDLASKNPTVIYPKQLAQSIFDHEILRGSHRGCSGITFNAITNAVVEPLILLGRFEKGIGYFSKKNEPIDLVVLIVAPHLFGQQYKNIVINVKNLLCNTEFMYAIRDMDSEAEIYNFLLQQFETPVKNGGYLKKGKYKMYLNREKTI
jgi:mannitol/fructose-specific phosphotransferase system IIA component (Ntr-type)